MPPHSAGASPGCSLARTAHRPSRPPGEFSHGTL